MNSRRFITEFFWFQNGVSTENSQISFTITFHPFFIVAWKEEGKEVRLKLIHCKLGILFNDSLNLLQRLRKEYQYHFKVYSTEGKEIM